MCGSSAAKSYGKAGRVCGMTPSLLGWRIQTVERVRCTGAAGRSTAQRRRVAPSSARREIPCTEDDPAMIAPSTLPLGAPAPDFTLPSTAGADVSLAGFRGRRNVLLAFFPLAFTSTCTAELCAFTDDFDRFGTASTAVLPISVDAVPSLKEFKAKYQMKVDLLSDFRRTVSRAYDVLLEDKYFSKRAS